MLNLHRIDKTMADKLNMHNNHEGRQRQMAQPMKSPDLGLLARESLRAVRVAPEPPLRDEEWDIEQSKTRDCMYPRMCLPAITDKNSIPNIRYDALGNPFIAYSTPYHSHRAPTPPDYTADGLIDIVVEEPWWKDVEYRVTPDGTCVTWPKALPDEPVDSNYLDVEPVTWDLIEDTEPGDSGGGR